MRRCLTLFLSLFFSLHFFKCKIAKSGFKGAWYFPCKSHFNLLNREVITLFLFAICLWWMLLFPLSPPGFNLSLKPKLENSKDELLKKVWIFTLRVLLIRKENRTMCNEKNHRDIYITINMPSIEDIVTWTDNPRQKSLKHLCTSLLLCNVEMWLQSYVATTTLQMVGGGGGKKGSRIFQSVSRFLSQIVVKLLLLLGVSCGSWSVVVLQDQWPKVHRICKGFFLRPTWSLRACEPA